MITQENVSLRQLNTFGIDVRTSKLIVVETPQEITEVADAVDFTSSGTLLLSGGSNVLLTKNLDTVVQLGFKGREVIDECDDSILLKLSAAENWHDIVDWTVSKNWFGLENLALIPGWVGTAPIQNIGAYGAEFMQVCEKVEYYSLDNKKFEILTNTECQFDYRDSIFKHDLRNRAIITSVEVRLDKLGKLRYSYRDVQDELRRRQIDEPSQKDVFDVVVAIRQQKLPDPSVLGNAGSYFKNPVINILQFRSLQKTYPSLPHYEIDGKFVKLPAGWLIEQCGWKGKTVGNVGVHSRQSLVIVNTGNASGSEVVELANKVKNSVKKTFDVSLEVEVNVI